MKTQCPNCKAMFNVDDKFAGRQAKCPKCTKPFIIQALVETPAPEGQGEPAAALPPVKSPHPAAPAAKVETPVETPAKIAEPVKPAVAAEPPVKSPQPAAPVVKSPEPIAPPATVVPPAPIAQPVKITEPVKEEKPESKPKSKALSKIVFVYCWAVVRIIAGVLGALGIMLAIRKEAKATLIQTFAAADVFLVLSALIELTLFYKMWAAIKDRQTSISPEKAVGFLFIPVFNIYWALCMVLGFAEDYNSFIQRRSIKTKELSFILSLIYAFAFMLTMLFVTVPMLSVFAYVGLISRAFDAYPELCWTLLVFASVAGIIHFFTYILFASKTCNAVNALPER